MVELNSFFNDAKRRGGLLYEAALRTDSFSKDIEDFKEKYPMMPLPPKFSKKEFLEWVGKVEVAGGVAWEGSGEDVFSVEANKGLEFSPDYLKDRMRILRKYGFSTYFYGQAMNQILLEEVPFEYNVDFIFYPEYEEKIEGEKAIGILIKEGASQKEVIAFIKDEWNQIRSHITGRKSIPRKLKDLDLVEKIFSLYSVSVNKLREKYPEQAFPETTKEILIKRILNECFGIQISSENIKQLYFRAKRGKKGDT